MLIQYTMEAYMTMYAALKATFKQYKETLRRSIKEARKFHRTFLLYQNNVRKTWSVIKETL